MWVNTEDLPTSDGHPFFERLNRVLEESGFDAFVEGLCEAFYACRLGRPSLRPGRYFRLLFIGYFEGVSSERGIAWRVADSLSLRSFLDLDMTEAAPDHSTLSRTRRRIDVETHEAVFTWVLERVAEAGLVRGKTVGIDATTLEANAAMRSIERRDTGESYEAFLRRLAEASGVETPTRADLARFDRSRKNKKTSNKEWQSPQDPDAKVAKMKDGRTHLAHKAEHGVDMDTGAIVSVTVQDASAGDSATLPETLTMAAEQVELVQPDGPGVEEVVADKGYHSDKTLVALDEIGIRSYVSEPERGQRCWQDKKTGETPPEKRAAQRALYGNRRRIRGARGRRLQRGRSELVERPFAHQYETGGLRRVWVRGHDNVRKRVLIQAAGCNIGLLLRRLTRRRHAPEPAGAGSFGDLRTDRASDRPLGASDEPLGVEMETGGVRRLNRSSPSCLNTPAQRTDFFHGLLRWAGREMTNGGEMRSKPNLSENDLDDRFKQVINRLGTTVERADLDDQIVYVANMLNGRRRGLEHMQRETVRLQGEVQMFESLLATLLARTRKPPAGFMRQPRWSSAHIGSSSAQVLADGSFTRADARGVADDHGGILPSAGQFDGMRGSPAGGELDGETDAASVGGPPTLEAGRGAGGGEPAVDLVDAEADDRIPRFW